MTKHTPGPWFADTQGAPSVRIGSGSLVCGVPRNYQDAVLIAAAPEMLDALKVARHIIKTRTDMREAVTMLDEVINKAEGK